MALKDPSRVSAGIVTCWGGVNSGDEPSDISDDQVAWAENITLRGGRPKQRPGFRQISTVGSTDGDLEVSETAARLHFQGSYFYEDANGHGCIIVSAGGRTFRYGLVNNLATALEITDPNEPNNSQAPIIYHQQVDNCLAVQDGSSMPLLYDGANSRRAARDEVPIGSGPMAYGMGRLWVAQGYEYVAGDIKGGPTGVLKFTENEYLNEGGSFTVPLRLGGITAMQFTAAPNTALGQGELFIATPDAAYSTVVPTDRDAWKTLSDPIQRIVLINNGSQSHAATVLVNGDLYIRSRDGIRSVIQAVRDFSQPGNLPVSREMGRALNDDNPDLLKFTSGILFENRLLMTTQARSKWNGAYFNGLAVLDFDLISSVGKRRSPVWDGVWTGLQFLSVMKGRFNGVERAFAVVRNPAKGFIKQVIVKVGEATALLDGPVVATFTGGGGTGATFLTRYKVSSATINAAGTGYAVGDVGVMAGPSPNIRQASWIVTTVNGGGGVTGISLIHPGDYGTDITAPSYATTTTGSGTGFRVAVVSFAFALDVTNGGSGFDTAPTLSAGFQTSLSACPNFEAYAVMEYEWELWEITRDSKFDYYLDDEGVSTERRITSVIESKSWPFASSSSAPRDTKRLAGAEIGVRDLVGVADFTIQYRPDLFPCWQDWKTWQYSSTYKDCETSVDCEPSTYLPQIRPRNWIPEPPQNSDPTNKLELTRGREFQIRLSWTGSVSIRILEVICRNESEATVPPCVPTTETAIGLECPCNP